MKKNLFIISLLFISLGTEAQDAKEILRKMLVKCHSVQNGYYEMTCRNKFMSGNDTSSNSYKCHFKKLENDSLYSAAFHYQQFSDGKYIGDVMYTGDEFVTFSSKDSSATLMSNIMWVSKIKAYKHNYKFYELLTNNKSFLIYHDSDFIDGKNKVRYVGEENINGAYCYRIRLNEFPNNDSAEAMKTLRIEYEYWIEKDNFLPIQYSIAFDMVMNNDTMYQYEKIVLDKYEINNLSDDSLLKLSSIPSYYKLKDFVPYESPKLLPKDTIAPRWELPSLTDEKVNLEDFKGQLVLIDFFYKSCYPCMQALPGLQALHLKYKDKGLKIIGIDPYDKKEDGLAAFLAKRGVTYTILLEGKDAAKNYRVSGYPTMYLIDRKGNIIFTQVGYGKGVDEVLEEVIKKNL